VNNLAKKSQNLVLSVEASSLPEAKRDLAPTRNTFCGIRTNFRLPAPSIHSIFHMSARMVSTRNVSRQSQGLADPSRFSFEKERVFLCSRGGNP